MSSDDNAVSDVTDCRNASEPSENLTDVQPSVVSDTNVSEQAESITKLDEGIVAENVSSEQKTSSDESTSSASASQDNENQASHLAVDPVSDSKNELSITKPEVQAPLLPDTAEVSETHSDSVKTDVKSGSLKVAEIAAMEASAAGAARETSGEGVLSVYYVKWIKYRGSTTPIVMQNQNGPCPLLAIVNILLLQGKIRLATGTEFVAADQLIEYIADHIFENVPKHITDATRLNYEQNMHDAIAVFPRLQTGLDVNVRFTGVSDFEYTPECIVFDLLDIPLVHGWLVDPEQKNVAEALGSCSYNQIVEKIIQNKNSDKEALVTSALIAEEFLNTTASQLTYHGLCELCSTLNDEQLCILFRNNHFSTLYKRKGELFVLVTDQGFLNEPNVVWETLSNVEGDGHFVDSNFHAYRLPESCAAVGAASLAQSPPVNSKEQIDHDYLVALSLEQEQSQASGGDVWMDTDAPALSDHELAVRLQHEEEMKAGAVGGSGPAPSGSSSVSLQRQQKAAPTANSGGDDAGTGGAREKKTENCIIL